MIPQLLVNLVQTDGDTGRRRIGRIQPPPPTSLKCSGIIDVGRRRRIEQIPESCQGTWIGGGRRQCNRVDERAGTRMSGKYETVNWGNTSDRVGHTGNRERQDSIRMMQLLEACTRAMQGEKGGLVTEAMGRRHEQQRQKA